MRSTGRLLQFTDALISARQWEHRRLRTQGSQLMVDLLTLVLRCELAGRPAALKELINSLPYSEAGIRKNLSQCVADGWVTMTTSPRDGRVRIVKPRAKLVDAWAEYEALFTSTLLARRSD